MVEIWLGILIRKALRGASFNSKQKLKEAIDSFCKVYTESAKPFVWKKRDVKGSQLKNIIANLMKQTRFLRSGVFLNLLVEELL